MERKENTFFYYVLYKDKKGMRKYQNPKHCWVDKRNERNKNVLFVQLSFVVSQGLWR